MTRRPLFNYEKAKSVWIVVQLVFKANFNDTYYLSEKKIPLDELDRDALTWFDPYDGNSNKGGTLVAIAECSDEEFVLLEKCGDIIKKHRHTNSIGCIVDEDNNESTLLAAQICITK